MEFVAELSINHLGMVNIAKKMILAAKNSGATLIKLKLKNVEKYYDSGSQKKWRNFDFKDYRKSLELSADDFYEIDEYCKSINIRWFCTVHDSEGLEFIREFNPPFYKVASMDSNKKELVDEVKSICKEEGKPLIISIGGKSDQFTDNLLRDINNMSLEAYILHTVSIYPTPAGKSNIMYISDLIKKYQSENIKIGYSGHEEGFAASLLSASLGASMIERHFCLSRDFNIHHINCALNPDEYSLMVNTINQMKEESLSSFNNGFSDEENDFLVNKRYV